MNRISGPVLDRIDLHVHVSPLSFSELYGERPEESSATIRLRVVAGPGGRNRPDSPDCRFIATPRWEASRSAHSVRCLPNRKPCCAVPWNACTFRPGLRPHRQSSPNDRRSGRRGPDRAGPHRRSDPLPAVSTANRRDNAPFRYAGKSHPDASRRTRGSDNAIQRRTRLDKQSHTQRQENGISAVSEKIRMRAAPFPGASGVRNPSFGR